MPTHINAGTTWTASTHIQNTGMDRKVRLLSDQMVGPGINFLKKNWEPSNKVFRRLTQGKGFPNWEPLPVPRGDLPQGFFPNSFLGGQGLGTFPLFLTGVPLIGRFGHRGELFKASPGLGPDFGLWAIPGSKRSRSGISKLIIPAKFFLKV